MNERDKIENEIREIVNRETRAWDTQDVDLLIAVFHPDMVWPWPPTAAAHDPMDWVLVLGRFDAERWKQVWRDLFAPYADSQSPPAAEDRNFRAGRWRVRGGGRRYPVARPGWQGLPMERTRLQGL
jgi:hypothetical protein